MKKFFLILSFILFSFVACTRKQDLRELEPQETLAEYPAHCYNQILDSDELGVDCGGSCASCNTISPSCTPSANTIKIGTSSYASTGSSCGLSGGNYEFHGNYSGGSYTITLGSAAPDLSTAYSITTSIPSQNQAAVTISNSSLNTLYVSTGTVYISNVGGTYHAIICSGSAYSYVTFINYQIEGDVSCP